jgi:small-conductance mechanosensitive channel
VLVAPAWAAETTPPADAATPAPATSTAATPTPAAPAFAVADAPAPPVQEAAQATSAGAVPVKFRGETLLEVVGPIGELSPAERAAAIERRLAAAAALPDSTLDEVRTQRQSHAFDVYAGRQFLMSVTAEEAARLGRTAEQRAADLAVVFREALRREYAERSAAGLARATVQSAIGIAVAVLAWLLLGRAFAGITRLLRRLIAARESGDRSAGGLLSEQVADLVEWLLRAVRVIVGFVLALFAIGYALSLFPWTRGAARQIDAGSREAFRSMVAGVVDYLPNLVSIAIFVLAFRLLIRFARLFFARVGSGDLAIGGFHPEWAAPTFQIVRVMLVAFAVAMIYPYLPASDSRAFQGVTVLLGVVLSFGSATAVANLIGGLVITYMRALAIGDRVRIGEVEGDVVGRDAFVVRVRTIKNVEVTIPNSAVLSGPVVNYSAGLKDRGLLVHTSATIGYDAPWRRVHELLTEAARRTPGVEAEPAPFVLQTALGDFAVSYQVNAWTRQPARASAILSDLHANIQDEFARAGIEIMSPVFEVQRDGPASTVPRAPSPGSGDALPGAARAG